MLEHVFRRERVRQRIRDNPIGSVLEQYVAYLVARGHPSSPIHQYDFVAEHFGRWLGPRDINRHQVRQFTERHLSVCRCTTPATGNLNCVRAALNRLLEMVGEQEATTHADEGFIGRVLSQYAHHLESVQGLAAATIGYRLRYARMLLRRGRISRTAQLAELTTDRVRRIITGEGRRCRPSSGQVMACSIRAFLRFLQFQGLVKGDLAAIVPTFANWRLASLPATVSAKELEQLTRACDTTSPIGLRDRAILLCMIELGLRASDVADLRLDGVDLAAGVLRLRRRKQRESAELPMPPRLVAAIRTYLQQGRPHRSPSPNVFVLHRAPRGQAVTSIGVRNIILRRAAEAGLADRIRGSHVIRHSVACRLINAGATLKQIADLLGHRSINTTRIYAKVDLASLLQVALPWPAAQEAKP